MAAPAHHSSNSLPGDTPITIKISVNDSVKKLKLPLRDLGATALPDKLRQLLGIKPEQTVTFERFSDSAGTYIALDPSNPAVFKTLIRAAKAKLKLRLKATVSPLREEIKTEPIEMPEEKAKQSTMEPVIVRTPVYQNQTPRESTALDRRSVGEGIFEFREARLQRDPAEAPVPRPFSSNNESFFDSLAQPARELAFRNREPAVVSAVNTHPWSVYCDACDVAMTDAHFHCNMCNGGDYDLCLDCVAAGKLCPGEGHWLIKRVIKDGKVISSTTERISPRQPKAAPTEPEVEKEVPGAFTDETKTLAEPQTPTRTCNSCVVVLPEREFVTCTTCADFDLCITCHVHDKHGHHPAHGFKPATEGTLLPLTAEMLLAPGRNVRHSAICDGCDKKILGVRYKCLNCPDWDFCSDCHKNAQHIHPRHRFAPLYEPIPEPRGVTVRHVGIYCDGPLCSSKTNQDYIEGVRYKCAVCHDTDFCASCEALPGNQHNRTHPLIKFKTPVRNVSITTENEDLLGQTRTMGDRRPAPVSPAQTKSAPTETTPVQQANAATQVQTVAEIKPTATQPIPIVEPAPLVVSSNPEKSVPSTLLNAHFVHDAVYDGTTFEPGARFTQLWTLRNPGPFAWPAGCSVRFVGGDNMLNIDNARPGAVPDLSSAGESNVVGRDVQVGEEVAFKVTLKAPTREGKHISYWRMKAADGTPFGHRLWCDIVVKKAPQVAKPVSTIPPPPTFAPKHPMFPVPSVAVPRVSVPQVSQPVRQLQPLQFPGMPYTKHVPDQQLQQSMQATAKVQDQTAQAQAAQAQAQQLRNVQQQMAQQQFLRQQQMMAHRQEMMRREALNRQAAAPNAPADAAGPPPYYMNDTANISARIAAMREHQTKRREHMMQQFNAQLQEHETSKASAAPSLAQPPSMPNLQQRKEEDEKARKEASRLRVEHIKAKILRSREEKANQWWDIQGGKAVKNSAESAKEQTKAWAELFESKKRAEAERKIANEAEKVKKIIEEITKDEAKVEVEPASKSPVNAEAPKEELENSHMIFPKLDKESPASSTYQSVISHKGKAAYVENEQGEVERSASPTVASPAAVEAPASPLSEDAFEDLEEDIEVLSAGGEESEDDGFLTDEEYDILDASDNETVASK